MSEMFNGGKIHTSTKRKQGVFKLSETINNLSYKKLQQDEKRSELLNIINESSVSNVGNAVLSAKKERSVAGVKNNLKTKAYDYFLTESLFLLFSESILLDNSFKSSYQDNLYKLSESILNSLFPDKKELYSKMKNSYFLEEIDDICNKYASILVQESFLKTYTKKRKNKGIKERLVEFSPKSNSIMSEGLEDIEPDLIPEEFIMADEENYDDKSPIHSDETNTPIPSMVNNRIYINKDENILNKIKSEIEPEDDRLIQEKEICSEETKVKFKNEIYNLLQEYNTITSLTNKVAQVIKKEVDIAKQEKEMFDDLSDKAGFSIKSKSNTAETDLSMDNPIENSTTSTTNDFGMNSTSADMNNNENDVSNKLDTNAISSNTPEENGPAGSNNPKDGKVETNVSANTYGLTESTRNRNFMGKLNNKLSENSAFKTIQIELIEKNKSLLNESKDLMENIFAETISYYTFLEMLNMIKLYDFRTDKKIKNIVKKVIK